MGLAYIVEREQWDNMCGELAQIKGMLIALTEPKWNEPDPNELWTTKRIAEASGLNIKTVRDKMILLAKERHIELRKKGNCYAIPYKFIAEMNLKNFKP